MTLYLVTNRPRMACEAAFGGPAPSWAMVATEPEQVAAIPDGEPVFAVLYGENTLRFAGSKWTPPRSPLATAWDRLCDRRAALLDRGESGVVAAGLDETQWQRLVAWKARRQLPGVLPGFPEGFAEHTAMPGRIVAIRERAERA